MTNVTCPLQVGDIVRLVLRGEDQNRRQLDWTKLRGRVRAVWQEGREYRVEVSFFGFRRGISPIGSCLPADYVVKVG